MAISLRKPTPPDAEPVADGPGHGRSPQGGRRDAVGGLRGRFAEQPVLNSALALLCLAVIVLAIAAIGPASQSSGQTTRTATAKQGVVQSTVSGSGNVQSATELDLGFKTSGTVTHIYVKQGQQVAKGKLLATLDPQDAEVTLEQSKASLQSAEASLAALEENEGESTSSQGATGATASTASLQTSSSTAYSAEIAAVSSHSTARASATTSTTTTPTTTTPTPTTPTTTTPTTTKKGGEAPATRKSTSKESTNAPTSATSTPTVTGTGTPAASESKATQSAATREANLASAEATVKTDRLTVKSDERAVQNTKLYAPEDGTIVSLSGEVGQTVSATGTTKATSSSSSTSSSASSSSSGKTGSTSSSPAGSSEGASSGSTFMVLSDLNAMQLVVALSESEIGKVHVGQIATLTIEALDGQKVAAHVTQVAQTPTSTSGAASYDVTFQLDQDVPGLKVGMSATAEVVIKQAEGVNVPTSATKGGSVTVLRDGKQVSKQVTTGLAGDSATIILSGLEAGATVVLPSATTGTGSSGASPFGSGRKSGAGGLGSSLGGGGFPAGGPPSGGFPAGGP